MIRPRLAPAYVLIAAILCLGCATAAAADNGVGGDMVVTKDMKPWEGCGECHDLNGVAPNGHFPSLAGQSTAYFLKQMRDFRDGKRTNDHGQMGVSSRETTGAVLREVAGYFAGLPAPQPQPVKGLDMVAMARAQLLFAHGSRSDRIPPCADCHGPAPKHDFVAPCLEAQQRGYLAKQLEDFRAGRRANDPERVMEKIAQRLSDGDIDALSTYLASRTRPAGDSCARERR